VQRGGPHLRCHPLNTSDPRRVPHPAASPAYGGQRPGADYRADYRWMNSLPACAQGNPTFAQAGGSGCGRLLVAGATRRAAGPGRRPVAACWRAGIPVWTDTALLRLDGMVIRQRRRVVEHNGREGRSRRRQCRCAGAGPQHAMRGLGRPGAKPQLAPQGFGLIRASRAPSAGTRAGRDRPPRARCARRPLR